MKLAGSLCVLVFLISIGGNHAMSAERSATTAADAVVAGDNQFAVDIYRQLDRQQPGKNLFCSPTSISLALAMAAAGARGPTQTEMAEVLHLGGDLPQSHEHFHKLLQQWNSADAKRPYQLRVANRLWGQQGFAIQPEFLELTRRTYDAEMSQLDFANAAAASRTINAWVERQTADKIRQLISPSLLDRDTRLVLTNAVYFKGQWLKPFDKRATQEQDFSLSAEQKVRVPLMHQKAALGYREDAALAVLELPYAGGDLSMAVLLPKTVDGLAEMEKSLSLAQLRSLLAGLAAQDVQVWLPRFKMEISFELKATLEALGMKHAFTADADFSGISAAEKLAISAVVHKAYVDVNEEGTEAAAATGVIMNRMAVMRPRPIPVFRADHPFLFVIRDMRSGSILFMGRVLDPR
jgi:serpin B